jgi:dihydrolipoamide dehydrogenase
MKIIVVGGGPGGYVAALKSAIMGAETVLIEKDKLGGTCLNRGCIPTKALLSTVENKEAIEQSEVFGITASEPEVDYGKVFARKEAIVNQLVGGVGFLCKKRGVEVINGTGKIAGPTSVEVTKADGSTETVEGDAIILATGSEPIVPGFLPYDGKVVITSDEVLAMQELPKDILIIGGGVIGCEFGYFYANMGVNVTIVEMMPHILPNEDEDLAAVLKKKLVKTGINIIDGQGVDSVEVKGDRAEVKVGDQTFDVDKVLVSIGRKSVTDDIGLDKVGITTEKGKIATDDTMKTSCDTIYAIGDIVNTPFLAHVASREGIVAVETIMGRDSHATYDAVPRCIYTAPEVGCVGVTEDYCKDKGIEYHKGQFGFKTLGKAMVMNESLGFVKIITDADYKVIGASIIGPHASDMISEMAVAIELGCDEEQLARVIHPHPSLAECVMEAIHDIRDESVHSF